MSFVFSFHAIIFIEFWLLQLKVRSGGKYSVGNRRCSHWWNN